ncbi:MAG: tetratricopeptide repeat protein [Planctomycetes bacterium]|nr:tetratricopeptide repeat protein [Planctomycetota bacterium]
MADDQPKDRDAASKQRGAPADSTEPLESNEVDSSSWSNLWQVPAIVLSVGLILLGLYVAIHRAPRNDFDGAFDQIDQLLASNEFELAAVQLKEVIEPNLHLATELQEARYHATVADWIALSQASRQLDLPGNNRRIAEQYAKVVQLGVMLDPARLERWAYAQIALGDLDAARGLLGELEALAGGSDAGLDVRRRRNRVLRRLVEFSLRQQDIPYESMMQLLEDYRAHHLLAQADHLWAIARQAELRLEAALAQEAIDHLLVDMRRLEPNRPQPVDRVGFGEPYTLLARAYYDLGKHRYAQYHVQQALQQLSRTDPIRGDALVLVGRLAVAKGQWHVAYEQFDKVVRDYAGTRNTLSGLLGRAEVLSVLGEPQRSLADYRKLRDLLPKAGPRRDVTPHRVARSLADRHDAALTMGKLEAALEYIMLAETFFEAGQVPADVLIRVASTSRQRADDLMAQAGRAPAEGVPSQRHLDEIDPAVRYEANELYRRAADYYVHHARSLAGRPSEDQNWADSLWLAADSYDLAGRHNLAIIHFTEYIAGRSDLDPRRPDAAFRLAQAYQAELDYESAVNYYQQVVADHPRSPLASKSHVPLARCYLALDRRPQAEQQLTQLLSGQRHLKPDARDYRDALIELGTLYSDNAQYVRAIERLDEAVQRYPDDPRIDETRFRLADTYRRHAVSIIQQLNEPAKSPAERQRLEALRADHLRTAMELFTLVGEAGDASDPPSAGRMQQLLRYSYLYRADCAFELGLYEQAVKLYDEVAGRYPQHHSSMTALIQIVNCYSKLGETNRARSAHRRALVRLKQLPDDAFSAPDALLDRGAWERWLENIPLRKAELSAAGS